MMERIKRKLRHYPISVGNSLLVIGIVLALTIIPIRDREVQAMIWQLLLLDFVLVIAGEAFINWLYEIGR